MSRHTTRPTARWIVPLVITSLAVACGGKSSSGGGSTAAATTSGTATAPTPSGTAPSASPNPTTSPSPAASPSPAGSGGSGGGVGLVTRTITTQAQPGIPATTIDYDVYVPTTYDPATPAPVLVAALMGVSPWQAIADADGLIVIDFQDHDRNGGYNFSVDVLGLQAILADVAGAWNVDLQRRYYHGFSAGAHWGYTIVLANANTFAGLGINAGSLTIATQQGVWPSNVQRPIPVVIRHGDADAVVPVQAGRDDRDRLLGAGHAVVYDEFSGGHTVGSADAAAVWGALRTARSP